MMVDAKIKIAVGLLLGVVSFLGTAQTAHAATTTEIRYTCDRTQALVVEQTYDAAEVRFIDRSYSLRRAASSIGEKFLSATAALIIDGRSAVFVAEDRLQLGQCIEASRIKLANERAR